LRQQGQANRGKRRQIFDIPLTDRADALNCVSSVEFSASPLPAFENRAAVIAHRRLAAAKAHEFG
jgi:hypothetical protein